MHQRWFEGFVCIMGAISRQNPGTISIRVLLALGRQPATFNPHEGRHLPTVRGAKPYEDVTGTVLACAKAALKPLGTLPTMPSRTYCQPLASPVKACETTLKKSSVAEHPARLQVSIPKEQMMPATSAERKIEKPSLPHPCGRKPLTTGPQFDEWSNIDISRNRQGREG